MYEVENEGGRPWGEAAAERREDQKLERIGKVDFQTEYGILSGLAAEQER